VLSLVLILGSSTVVIAQPRVAGYHPGTEVIGGDGETCPGAELVANDDGSMENGYAWGGINGVQPPDYGSWAECYDADYVCGVQFLFTTLPQYFHGQNMDVYVWSVDSDNPGNVMCLVPDVVPEPPALWPEISTHDVQVCCATGGPHFVGFWGDWPGLTFAWFIASDETGPGDGCPRTKISPGIGHPTGWQHPGVVPLFGGCRDLGIREHAGVGDCEPTPTPAMTWGHIKALY
jgi:hypothetical protein